MESLQKLADDPNEWEAFISRMNELQKAGATIEEEPIGDADLLVVIEQMRRTATLSLEDQRTRRVAFDVWREETSDLLADESIERSRMKRFRDR